MTLKIKHPEVDKLAKELAHTTGETVSEAIMTALRERLEREQARQKQTDQLVEKLLRIGQECAALPVLDSRIPEDIIDYDQYGVPV
jgi:antitoxin VapB